MNNNITEDNQELKKSRYKDYGTTPLPEGATEEDGKGSDSDSDTDPDDDISDTDDENVVDDQVDIDTEVSD